jgi:hypothetical protein
MEGPMPEDLSELAREADKAGRGHEAIELARKALRHDYLGEHARAAAVDHDDFGNYLARNTADYRRALAHHLAAAVLLTLTGTDDEVRHCLLSVARDLERMPGDAVVPASIGELSAAVAEVHGVHLDALLAQLDSDPAAVQDTLGALLGKARTWADPDTPLPRHFASWDPVIAGLIAARDGNEQARAAVEEHLAERARSADWAALAGALSAILTGRNDTGLLDGLSKIDTAITARALDGLRGDGQVPSQLWPAIPFTPLIGRMVAAGWGDKEIAGQLAGPLARMETDDELAPLAGVLRRILDGEPAPALARGLDPVPAAIVITILFHLPPAPVHLPPASQP